MSNYSFSDEAVQDLDQICEYIARSNPSAASTATRKSKVKSQKSKE